MAPATLIGKRESEPVTVGDFLEALADERQDSRGLEAGEIDVSQQDRMPRIGRDRWNAEGL